MFLFSGQFFQTNRATLCTNIAYLDIGKQITEVCIVTKNDLSILYKQDSE